MTVCDGIKVHFPHQNLGELGFEIYGLYIGITLPHRERWGWTWWNCVRVFYRLGWSRFARKGYLMLPSFRNNYGGRSRNRATHVRYSETTRTSVRPQPEN